MNKTYHTTRQYDIRVDRARDSKPSRTDAEYLAKQENRIMNYRRWIAEVAPKDPVLYHLYLDKLHELKRDLASKSKKWHGR